MDSAFPRQLFPTYFNSGPPKGVFRHTVDGWGLYDHAVGVSTQDGSSRLADWKFTTSHQFRGETWLPTEPVAVPLLSPKTSLTCPSISPEEMDFIHHMQNFYLENFEDAFYSTSQLLGEHLFFHGKSNKDRKTKKSAAKQSEENITNMWRTNRFMERLKYKSCEYSYFNDTLTSYGNFLYDVIPDIPVDLLANLVEEELNQHRDKLLLNEETTGGALAYVPFTQGSTGGSQQGCLLYPGKEAFSLLKFHKVVIESQEGKPAHLDTTSNKPFCFQLKGSVRQISSVSLLNQCCVGVRSDYLCGVFRLDETMTPRLLKVVETREPASCINVSPHVLGEVLVASRSGAAHLWNVAKGVQKVREEDSNLYFNAQSPWRWCDFSGHPRVMVYADRTGAELTDIRTSPWSSHSLFRVGQGPDCKSGERVINTKYLGDTHTFHHLVTTQFSAYILDERVPGVPMLKWEHMMEYPPVFGHVLPGSSSSCVLGGASSTAKVVLGSQTSQDLTLLQYSGGRAEACVRVGPPQTLLRPRDSFTHLPVQIPHRLQTALTRISQPAAGLTCIQKNDASGGADRIWVLQLTEAGDIFYQILKQQQQHENDMPRPLQEELVQPQSGGINKSPQKQHLQPAHQTDSSASPSKQTVTERTLLLQQDGKPNSEVQPLAMDTSSDEDILGPTQNQDFVPETQEMEHPQLPPLAMDISRPVRGIRRWSGSSSEDSQDEGPRRRILASLGLEVVVNAERDDCDENLLAASHSTDRDTDVGTQETVLSVRHEEENTGALSCIDVEHTDLPSTTVQLSDAALAAWKRWLYKLSIKTRMKRQLRTQARDKRPQTYRTVPTRSVLSNKSRDAVEEQSVASLRRDMKECMAKGSVLVGGNTTELVPLPNPVDTEVWVDELSERLTVSWTGGEVEYNKWWQEHLGLNKEEKKESLRNKRRRQKEERRRRRAASGTSELSASFSSTSGWSSTTGVDDGWCDIDLDSSCSSGGLLSQQDFLSQQEFMSQSSTLATHLANTLASMSQRQTEGEQRQLDATWTAHVHSPDRPVEQSQLSYQENLDSLAPSQEESREPQNVTVDNVATTNVDSAIPGRSTTPAPRTPGRSTTPTLQPSDRSATPAPRPPDRSTTPTLQPSDCSATPAPRHPDRSTTPTLQPSDRSATPARWPPDCSATPALKPSSDRSTTPALRPSSPPDSQSTLLSTPQDPIARMGFSQPTVLPSFSLQSPMGVRVSLSQLQTPKRKKSRMGF